MHSSGTPTDLRRVETARMLLTPAGLGALDAMADLHADERVWRHLPSGRHTEVEQTRRYLLEREQQWRRDGLGYWIVTLLRAVGELAAGDIAGIGGCAVPPGATWWNLYYRLSPAVHRQGLATELCAAAIDAAHRSRRDRPVIAFLLENNVASMATAQRAGLRRVWRGPDAGNPDPTAVRLVYADRELDPTRLAALTAMT